jgi:hypothetical protein
MAALNIFILFKICITEENQMGESYAFKDFVLDCVQKMTESQDREYEKDSADDESLTSTPALRKRQRLKNPADRLQGGLRKYKMVHVPARKKNEGAASRRCRVCSTHERRKETMFIC